MVERKKIAGGGGETGAGARGIGNPPPQSRPVRYLSRLFFFLLPPSESLEQATFCVTRCTGVLVHLTPNVDCRKVTIPETKKMVLRTSLVARKLSLKHIGAPMMKGIPNVPPSIIR